MFGPNVTFLGVPRVELGALGTQTQDVVVLGAPFDSGASHRAGARFGPQAIRTTDYLPHDGSRPHLALGVDPLASTSTRTRTPETRSSARCTGTAPRCGG